MRLPNGHQAEVPVSRLTEYRLNPRHPVGKHKARVFAAALGLDKAGATTFQKWLLDLARAGDAEIGDRDGHGQRFVIRGRMRYNGREARVRTAWIVRTNRPGAPEFLTAFAE